MREVLEQGTTFIRGRRRGRGSCVRTRARAYASACVRIMRAGAPDAIDGASCSILVIDKQQLSNTSAVAASWAGCRSSRACT